MLKQRDEMTILKITLRYHREQIKQNLLNKYVKGILKIVNAKKNRKIHHPSEETLIVKK